MSARPVFLRVNVKADGQFQKVSGDPYRDAVMVKVVDDKHVEMASQKDGKDVSKSTRAVSDDGNTMTINWTYYANPTGGPASGTNTMKRVAKAPAGSQTPFPAPGAKKRPRRLPPTTLCFRLRARVADSLSYSTPTGQSYTAKLDDKDVPYVGDPGTTTASLKREGNSIVETDKRDGKVISIAKLTVSSDGKTMTIDVDDKLNGDKSSYVAVKQ